MYQHNETKDSNRTQLKYVDVKWRVGSGEEEESKRNEAFEIHWVDVYGTIIFEHLSYTICLFLSDEITICNRNFLLYCLIVCFFFFLRSFDSYHTSIQHIIIYIFAKQFTISTVDVRLSVCAVRFFLFYFVWTKRLLFVLFLFVGVLQSPTIR